MTPSCVSVRLPAAARRRSAVCRVCLSAVFVEDIIMFRTFRRALDLVRNHAKKCAVAVAAVVGFAAPAFAEGETGPDLTAATTALTTLKDALVGQNGWISSAAPILATLLGGILVITLIWVAYKWVSRGAKKAG